MKTYLSRAVLSWALYDFANSAFATTILSVIFNVYFVKVVSSGGVPLFGTVVPAESFWGYSVSASMLAVFFLAPLLGAAADFSAAKKKFLFFFWITGVIFTGLLFLCLEGDYWMAAGFFILANIGFSAGNSFYNAFLSEISSPLTVGRISGFGWALGYIGGGLLLALNLVLIDHPAWFGLSAENHIPVRTTFLSVSAWWFAFAVPFFLFVKERPAPARPEGNLFVLGFREVARTFRAVRRHREIFKFLLAYLVYNDGIETVILMASIFGAKELGLSQTDLILCFLMIQGVAFIGSLAFGALSDAFTHKASIAVTLWIYLAVCIWAVFMKTKTEFWILGAVVGLILGGSQSASRSLLTLLSPRENSAQFFGFFALAGKMTTVIGPFVFAFLSQLFSLRVAVGSLGVFFALGLVFLHFVQEPSRQDLPSS